MGIRDRAREFGDAALDDIETIQEPQEQEPEKKPITPYTMMERICRIEEKSDEVIKHLDNISKDLIDITNIVEKFRQVMEE